MNFPSQFAFSLVAMATISLSGQPLLADVSMTARQVGSNVEFSYSGTIDLTGLSAGGSTGSRGAVYPINSYIEFGPSVSAADATTFYPSVNSAPASIGEGSFQVPDSFKGSRFSINNNSFEVPLGYVSGSQISGSITFVGKTLMGLGIDSLAGPYTWELTDGQVVTLTILDAIAAPAPDNSALKMALKKKIKKLKQQIRIAKKKERFALLKKLKRKLKRANSQFRQL